MTAFVSILLRLYTLSATAYAVLLHYMPDDGLVLLVSNFRVIILAPALVSLAWFLSRRPVSSWTCVAFYCVFSIPWSLLTTPLYCTNELARVRKTNDVVALTLNLAGSSVVKGRDLDGLVRAEDIDVIGLQEVSPLFWRTEGQKLRRLLPHFIYEESAEGYWTQALLSRFPINTGRIYDPGDGFTSKDARKLIEASVTTEAGILRLYVAHASIPFTRSENCRGVRCLLGHYDQRMRDNQLLFVRKRLLSVGTPALLMGDLNLSDQSKMYESFSELIIDSGRCDICSRATWPADESIVPPFLRIDYIFYIGGRESQGGVRIESRTLQIAGTDHRAVLTAIDL